MGAPQTTPLVVTIPNRYDELYRRVRLTTGARFNAARRLGQKEHFTQWTIALLSVALIVVPLLQALNVTTGVKPEALNVLQVFLAVLVLVFSLLLGRDNFALRADKMHRSALQLNQLLRDLESHRGREGLDETYDDLCDQYNRILDQYDNHATVDYELYKLSRPDEFYAGHGWRRAFDTAKAWGRYLVGLVPYVLLFGVVAGAFWLMIK